MGSSIPRLDMEALVALMQFADECRQACIDRGETPMFVRPEWLVPTR